MNTQIQALSIKHHPIYCSLTELPSLTSIPLSVPLCKLLCCKHGHKKKDVKKKKEENVILKTHFARVERLRHLP